MAPRRACAYADETAAVKDPSPASGAFGAPSIVLDPIAKEKLPVLRSLYELYVHDFTEYVRLPLGPEGRFDVPIGDEWWHRDAGRLLRAVEAEDGSVSPKWLRVPGLGDAIAAEGIEYLRAINARRRPIGQKPA